MSYDKMDPSSVYAMFEEIKSKLDKQPEPTAPATPAVEIENIAELREAISKLNEVAESPREPQEHIHKHRIDLMSNKVLIMLGGLMTIICILAFIIHHHRETIAELRDNDLKYRYIEMRGSATPEDILMLREVFDFNRNADRIKLIRNRVEKFERLIREEAEQQARAKANSERAEQIRQEAATVKGSR